MMPARLLMPHAGCKGLRMAAGGLWDALRGRDALPRVRRCAVGMRSRASGVARLENSFC
jgi:hypothetical protein